MLGGGGDGPRGPPALVIAAAWAAVTSSTEPFGITTAGELAVAGSVTAVVVTTRAMGASLVVLARIT